MCMNGLKSDDFGKRTVNSTHPVLPWIFGCSLKNYSRFQNFSCWSFFSCGKNFIVTYNNIKINVNKQFIHVSFRKTHSFRIEAQTIIIFFHCMQSLEMFMYLEKKNFSHCKQKKTLCVSSLLQFSFTSLFR
jgi:hypothetical protein